MKRSIDIKAKDPKWVVATDVAFAQVEAFGHTRRDLKLDIIYPVEVDYKLPCIVWVCGGAWLNMDKSLHLAYLTGLARKGFIIASVEYRTSNEATYPAPLQDVKAAIRYLRAHAGFYNILASRIGIMGDSAGGYLAAMAALHTDRMLDVGGYLYCSSEVQAACPWYPPTDVTCFHYPTSEAAAASPESLLFGKNVAANIEEAKAICPVSYVTPKAPPFLIIHGTDDKTVPFSQGESLYNRLEEAGCDATLLAVNSADHADIHFFQKAVWDEVEAFFIRTLKLS